MNALRGVNIIVHIVGESRYTFLWDNRSLPQLLQVLGRYAADPELNFTWSDAASISQKLRRLQMPDQCFAEEP